MRTAARLLVGVLVAASAPSTAHADDVLRILEVRVDPATLHTVGVQMLISDDDDRDATVAVRARVAGGEWRDAPPLLRVMPETITESVPQQFAGTVFDVPPGSDVEVELHAVDPDGTDEVRTVQAATRPVPRREPANPRMVAVATVEELRAALSAAQAGDVIELADGTYAGSFSIGASGTADDPIVIRGTSADGVVLDGQGCADCNILEVYGSYVHVERMTFENAIRALRFQGEGASNCVARHLVIRDVVHGIGSRPGQSSFTISDNDIQGRLVWPWTFEDDATSHWDDRGVDMNGVGHDVSHNRIQGFGDPVVNKTRLVRAWDVHGNDIMDAFDGTELDEGEGNVRLYRNRFTNVMAPVSIQPSFGGPAYVIRNVGFNIPDEQIKLKSLGGVEEPSGVLIWNNTFVSPRHALNLQTPITQHNFAIENNLFVGPAAPDGRTVDWTAQLDRGLFDWNGYWPDSGYWFGVVDGGNRAYATLAEAQAAGVEPNGVVLTNPIFASGVVGPDDPLVRQEPADLALADGSNAIDRGRAIPGVSALYAGNGPDLGAIESGCEPPFYGPRPEGQEDRVALIACDLGGPGPGEDGGPGPGQDGGSGGDADADTDTDGDADGGPGAGGDDDGGCGCRSIDSGAGRGLALASLFGVGALLVRRRRHR